MDLLLVGRAANARCRYIDDAKEFPVPQERRTKRKRRSGNCTRITEIWASPVFPHPGHLRTSTQQSRVILTAAPNPDFDFWAKR